MKWKTAPVLLFSLLVGGGCGTDAGSGGGADAASQTAIAEQGVGVDTIEYSRDAWENAPMWRLDPTPLLAIGAVDGPPESEFGVITGALRLDDGAIVIADAVARELRFFDSRGEFLHSVGRSGGGPGEYSLMTLFAHYRGDSLLVWDSRLFRGTVLDRNGTQERIILQPDVGAPVLVHGIFGDGSLVGTSMADGGLVPGHSPVGILRSEATYLRFSAPGPVDTIARLFASEMYSGPNFLASLPFARHAVIEAAGRDLYYTSSDTHEIRTYTEEGTLARIVRFDRRSPLTEDDVDQALAKFGPDRRRQLASVSYPETMPSYQKMKVDSDGNLWVGDYLRPDEERRGWTILSLDGELLGRFLAPADLTVYDIGDDWLLGGIPGEMDVPRVLLFRLIKPS